MGFAWDKLTILILQLSRVAMEWYRLVTGGDTNGERQALKTVAIVLDPDRPEQSPDEVKLE